MPGNKEETLKSILLSFIPKKDDSSITELLESAHKGFTVGANDFVERASNRDSAVDIKNNLRTYPLAQLLISIVKYHELNKDTDVIRRTALALLDSLEGSAAQEALVPQTAETTLH